MNRFILFLMIYSLFTLSVTAQYNLDVDGQVNFERSDNLSQRLRILTQGTNADAAIQIGTGGSVTATLGWDGSEGNFFIVPQSSVGFNGFNMKEHQNPNNSDMPINFGFGTQSTLEDKVLIFNDSQLGSPHLNLIEDASADLARLQFAGTGFDNQWTIAAGLESVANGPKMHFVHRPDVSTTADRVMTIDGDDLRVGIWDNNPDRSLSINYSKITTSIWSEGKGLGLKNVGTEEGDVDDYEWLFYVKGTEFSGEEGDLILLSNFIDSPANGSNYSRGVFDGETGVYAAASDRSLKKNIKYLAKEKSSILNKIQQLKPATYQFKNQRSDRYHLGLIAQEVQAVFPEVVHSITDDPSKKLLGVSYASLVPVLIAGIKEQQEDLTAKTQQIEDLQDEMKQLKQEMVSIRALLTGNYNQDKAAQNESKSAVVLQKDYLLQNAPNPFHATTTIRYELPENSTDALLQITDIQGNLIKTISLKNQPQGQIELHKGTLAAGIYTYSLFVNGQRIDSKKMLLTK